MPELNELTAQYINDLLPKINEQNLEKVIEDCKQILLAETEKDEKAHIEKAMLSNTWKILSEDSRLTMLYLLFCEMHGMTPSNPSFLPKPESEQSSGFQTACTIVLALLAYIFITISDLETFNKPQLLSESNAVSQNFLISRIIEYLKTQSETNEQPSFVGAQEQFNKMSGGLCFGLSSLFLQAAFISDMDKGDDSSDSKDDLNWFNRCIILLLLPHDMLSEKQQYELSRFISFVLLFQNAAKFYPEAKLPLNDPNINRLSYKNTPFFNYCYKGSHFENTKVPAEFEREGGFGVVQLPPSDPTEVVESEQHLHLLNAQFSGKHTIDWSAMESFEKPENLLKMLNEIPSPSYIIIELFLEGTYGHTASMHKNKDGKFTYYDPNSKFYEVNLSSLDDLEAFFTKHLINFGYKFKQHPYLYPASDMRKALLNTRFMVGTAQLKPKAGLSPR